MKIFLWHFISGVKVLSTNCPEIPKRRDDKPRVILLRRQSSEILFVFKKNSKVTSIYSQGSFPPTISSCSATTGGRLGYDETTSVGHFSGICGGNILVGWTEALLEPKFGSIEYIDIGYKKPTFESPCTDYLYKFEVDKRRWIEVQRTHNSMNIPLELDKERRREKISCILDNMMFICEGRNAELLQYDDRCRQNISNSADESSDPTTLTFQSCCSKVNRKSGSFCSQTICPTQLPLRSEEYTLTNIGPGEVMLIYGADGSNRVFEGNLTANKNDVTWKELESLGVERQGYISFKLNGNVYIAGGSQFIDGRPGMLLNAKCQRYDLLEKKWYKCQHNLPFPLSNASVVVSTDESFAVIIGEYFFLSDEEMKTYSGKVIIFTEDRGFTIFEPFSLRSARDGQISIGTP